MADELDTVVADSQAIGDLRRQLDAARRRIAALEACANEDALLGILNRRGIEAELERAIAFSERYRIVASVIFIDLDEFKAVNDEHGHSAGDALLRHLVGLIESNVRKSDRLGRIGGDEFVVLLWNATHEVAENKARALAEIVKRNPLTRGKAQIALSISCGVAELHGEDSAATLLARADAAMYREKKFSRGKRRRDALKR
ncbi:MAG: GGDEF domain-containing protein [Rhodobiaceae bacterium]|nr:GGDEF domain-containing protein [Rhodobiaceae bacterium]MCC0053290.1 GGDEF domain-containing protein [Rhodobiaceae bacterium]